MTNDQSIDRPFPLKRRFLTWIVPGLLLFVGILVFTTYRASLDIVRDIYLEQATRRAKGIAQGISQSHPEQWRNLVDGQSLSSEDLETLMLAFEHERREFDLAKLKVYDLNRLTLFATNAPKIGTIEDNEALRLVLGTGQPQALVEGQGTPDELYELYVPYRENGQLVAVFEIYEPTSYLNAILNHAALQVILIPGGLLIIMLLALGALVSGAQRAIDSRTQEVNSLRGRLEGLVSRRAAQAMRQVDEADGILSESVSCTLFYSDIRGFTSFSEAHTPAQVIDYLNKLMSLQIEVVERHGGDVDKFIGDALLAHFHDADMEARAVRAAIDIQIAMREQNFDLGIGIGIFSGDVIAGGIGAENRRDYTVIGDSVNVSARLCSMAAEGEIVCDASTLKLSGANGFSNIETCQVKGRKEKLQIQRLQP